MSIIFVQGSSKNINSKRLSIFNDVGWMSGSVLSPNLVSPVISPAKGFDPPTHLTSFIGA